MLQQNILYSILGDCIIIKHKFNLSKLNEHIDQYLHNANMCYISDFTVPSTPIDLNQQDMISATDQTLDRNPSPQGKTKLIF